MTFEEIDPRVIDTMRQLRREAEDAEYESSTPGAARWRERAEIRRPGSNPPAPRSVKPPPPPNPPPERSVKGDAPKYDAPMAQRHRFGRVLDLPPVNREARGDWLIWLTLTGLVLWAIGAGLIWWLT